MNKRIFALFPGQGSQRVGMGKDIYENSDLAKEIFSQADQAIGFPLSEICFNGPEEQLMRTAITQPAILTVSTICFRLAQSVAADKLNICAAAGHSLGEYSALVAAEAIAFSDAVQLVHKRGAYMQEAVPRGQGKMVAVLGKELEEIELALSKVTSGVAQAANINAPGQIVIAGDVSGVDQFIAALGSGKVKELPVSAPFHCALMKPAADNLKKDLSCLQINRTKFPVYANFSAAVVNEPEAIRLSLESQVCGRVRWIECTQNAIRDASPSVAIEFGFGSTLAGLLKRIDKSLGCINFDSLEASKKLFDTV